MKYLRFIVTPAFMGVMFFIFALSMAVATFIENDFGPDAARHAVYNSRWFELILLLLAVNLAGQLIIFRLFRVSRLPGALFHLSFIVMLAGAAITRYTGWEGSLHIREGAEQNQSLSEARYITYNLKDTNGNTVDSESEKYIMSASAAGKYDKELGYGDNTYRIRLEKMLPNADITISEAPGGEPVISFFILSKNMSGQPVILRKGERKELMGITIGFGVEADLRVETDSSGFYAFSGSDLSEMSMMTKEINPVQPGRIIRLKERQVLVMGDARIVPQSMSLSAFAEPVALNPGERITGQNAFIFSLENGEKKESIYLWHTGDDLRAVTRVPAGRDTLVVSYGSLAVTLPFTVKLNDFILERYPGSNSPSGYKSDVVLIDRSEGVEKPFVIFMNNILKYKGYRLYQSSYDRDEKGTILSVNHDPAGMLVTYTGYGLLILFIIVSLLNRNSLFHRIDAGHWNSKLRMSVIVLFLLAAGIKGNAYGQRLEPGKETSKELGKLLVQDQKGRTKPLFTLSYDILRKVAKESRFEGLTPMQVFLGIYFDFSRWQQVPLISVSNREVQARLNIKGKRASFADIVDLGGSGSYKISKEVEAAYNKAPGKRTKFDKEIMKIDERVNILYMIYTGSFMRIFPLRDGTHDWGSPEEALKKARGSEDSTYLKNTIPFLARAIRDNDISSVIRIRESISGYQDRYSGYELSHGSRVKAELLYYNLNIFEKLFPFYATVGILMLITLIVMVIKGVKGRPVFVRVTGWLLFAGFLFHTFGLGLRWYISGHSPMSNGYESMLFISWVTLLAGFIFARRSAFALSATAVLGSMTLLVAHMSFMDPEITNLVPVLKSYWLTLHVSVITGSYGFLGLGAIMGLISLVLITLADTGNRARISQTIDELTVINYKALTLGLYFLTIGTFLGAIWANESWGRYWGWDPKETWSLITIIVYSLVIHSRFIPGMKDIYTFNLLSLFAFSSVLMTYFGVNYYLSGLHSYAGGDPVPVPAFVYITVFVLAALAFLASRKYNKFRI